LKEASEGTDRRSGSREFHTERTAVVKARDAKYEATATICYAVLESVFSCYGILEIVVVLLSNWD